MRNGQRLLRAIGASVLALVVCAWLPAWGQSTLPLVGVTPPLPDQRAVDQALAAGTLNAAVTVTTNNGQGVVAMAFAGLTASGARLTFEATANPAASSPVWTAVAAIHSTSGATATTAAADGQYRVGAAGWAAIRARVSTTGSGTITVGYSAAVGGGGVVTLAGPVSASIGEVTYALPITATTYAADAVIGALTAVTVPETGWIVGASIMTPDAQPNFNVDVVIYRANPTASTLTNNTGATFNYGTDKAKIARVFHVNDCTTGISNTPTFCQNGDTGRPFVIPAGTSTIWVALINRTSTLTAANLPAGAPEWFVTLTWQR